LSAFHALVDKEFGALFRAPVAWIVIGVFLGLMGFFFHNFVASFVEMVQTAPMRGGEAPPLEQLLRAYFYNIHFVLILVIPAVTMSSFSEEKRNQTIRLLLTSPVTATQIVAGKYLASVAMLGVVLLCSAVYPLFTLKFGNPDAAVVWISYVGIFLLMCAQIAYGLWVSSMTTNQFMAFLFTMFGLFLLLILNWIAPNLTGGGLLEAVVRYMASTDHLDTFFKGMVTVNDVAYFACFAAMFLFFTNVVLDSQRWR
jgi:ABC-2 type transport system permease protein